MSKKSKMGSPVATATYTPAQKKLVVRVSLTARPADYESLVCDATLESHCEPNQVDSEFDKSSKSLRRGVADTMGKLMRDYDGGVANAFRQATKKSK